MLLLGVLPTVLVVGLIIGGNLLRAYRAFEVRAEWDIMQATREAAAEIDAQSQKMAVLAATLGRAQSSGGMFGRRAETLLLLKQLTESEADVQGAYIVYQPNADGADAASLLSLPPESMDLRGRFVPYWRKDPSRPEGVRLEPRVSMDDPDYLYYLEPKRLAEREAKQEVVFTKPYFYESAAMIEQVFPIVVDGRFVGVAGVDRSLETIDGTLAPIADRLGGDILLATRGLFIASTTDIGRKENEQLKTTSVVDSPFRRLMLTHTTGPGDVRVVRGIDPVLGTEYFYGVAELEHGGWTLLLRKPTAQFVAELWKLLGLNVLSGLIGVTIIAVILIAIARGVGRRLDVAVLAASRVADGDLAHPVPIASARDESGVLLDSFRKMAENLNRIVGQVRHASIQINSTSTELAAASREQEATIASFGASTTQIGAATREISATGEELLRTMQVISESALGAGQKAQDSREGIESMRTSMNRLEHAAHNVASRLGAINEKAQGINAIVAAITKVADQTNLLSVNAAIEAEKAGEFGLGFLVVAREIRRLADQTASATLDIERMIRQTQSAVGSGVMEMDKFGESLHAVQADVDRVSGHLQGIVSHVEDDTLRVVQVTEGMRNQAAGAKQIDEAMRTLNAGARQTLQSASEFGRAASDLQQAIAVLKTTVSIIKLRD